MSETVVEGRVSETTAGLGLRPLSLGRLTVGVGESELRYLQLDGEELVRRVFVAVRDVEWGTAPTLVENADLEVRENAFTSSVTALCRDPEHEVELRWHGRTQCDAEGAMTFVFR